MDSEREAVTGGLDEVPTARRRLAARTVPERISLTPMMLEVAISAEEILESGWLVGDGNTLSLRPPVDWDGIDPHYRSDALQLHAWAPVDVLLARAEEESGRRFRHEAVSLTLDWVNAHPALDTGPPFAWYDLAVASRASLMTHLLCLVASDPSSDDRDLESLLETARLHDMFLRDPDRIKRHNNHGLYHLAGHLILLRGLAGVVDGLADPDAVEREFLDLLEQHVAGDGTHLEHSPGYQVGLLRLIDVVVDHSAARSADMQEARDRMARSSSWLVGLDGEPVMFGDTDRTSAAVSPELEQSDGVWESEAGYFVTRSRDSGSYLAQIAAFHSRTHKHADDLSIVWFDRNEPILIDSGYFGYLGATEPGSTEHQRGFWYSDPRRMYVESTRAHNTIQIGDADHDRRGRRPYGSALVRTGKTIETAWAESHVRHGSIRHARVLLFRPGDWLLVFDWVWDNDREPRAIRQWFHLAPQLGIDVTPSDGLIVSHPDWSDGLHVLPVIRGSQRSGPIIASTSPELQGWWSPIRGVLEPAPAFCFEADGAPDHRLATLFAFGQEVHPDLVFGRASVSGRSFRVRWTVDGRRTTVIMWRPASGDVTLEITER